MDSRTWTYIISVVLGATPGPWPAHQFTTAEAAPWAAPQLFSRKKLILFSTNYSPQENAGSAAISD
jgi:hypothetical protein